MRNAAIWDHALLGGKYSTANSRWEWDDGTPIAGGYENWATGEGGAGTSKTYLCMKVGDGFDSEGKSKVRQSDAFYSIILHPVYTVIAICTPIYTRYTCIDTIYTSKHPINTPYTPV